jgi:HEPN domain-containing protein
MKMMNTQEKYEYWLESSEYDLATAKAMLDSGRWLYVVFMCQQALEKSVKGLYLLHLDDNVPRTHNIGKIFHAFEGKVPGKTPEKYYYLFDRLTSFYLQGRYTEYKQKVSALVDREEAETIYAQAKEAFQWLLTLRP